MPTMAMGVGVGVDVHVHVGWLPSVVVGDDDMVTADV